MSLLGRYESGEHEAVYRELQAMGPRVRDSHVVTDAFDVSREIADRAFSNLTVLFRRLTDLGYVFANPSNALVEASASSARLHINRVEELLGTVPIMYRAWYERTESVDFTQQYAQLEGKAHATAPLDVSGLGLNTVLVILSIDKCLLLRDEEMALNAEDGLPPDPLLRFIPLGGTASNNELKGFHLPELAFDGTIYDAGFGEVRFVEEIRLAMRYGGFPHWGILESKRRRTPEVSPAPDFKGLLPILLDGLRPL